MNSDSQFLSRIKGYIFPIGSENDPQDKAGVAQLYFKMFEYGTKSHPSPEKLFGELEKLGAEINMGVGEEDSYMVVTAPEEALDGAMEVVDEIFTHSNLDSEENLQKAKAKQKMEINDLKSNDSMFATALFKEKLLGVATGLGSIKTLESVTVQDIEKLSDRYKEVLDTFYLAGATKYEGGEKMLIDPVHQATGENGSSIYFNKKDIEQKVVIYGFESDGRRDYPYQIRSVAANCIGGWFGSPTMERIREEHSAAYYAFGAAFMQEKRGSLYMKAGVGGGNSYLALSLMKEIFEEMAADEFPDKLLELSKMNFKGSLDRTFDSPASLYSFYLGFKERGEAIPAYQEIVDKIMSVSKDDVIGFYSSIVGKRRSQLLIHGTIESKERAKIEKLFK